jgi:hypothetical protein
MDLQHVVIFLIAPPHSFAALLVSGKLRGQTGDWNENELLAVRMRKKTQKHTK